MERPIAKLSRIPQDPGDVRARAEIEANELTYKRDLFFGAIPEDGRQPVRQLLGRVG